MSRNFHHSPPRPSRSYNASTLEKSETVWGTRDGRDGFLDPETLQLAEQLFKEESTCGIHFSDYDNIPIEVSEEMPVLEEFTDVEIHEVLQRNISLMNYKKPTPVQRHAIPISILRRDLMACAQTGSGKTAAFLFPMFAKMLKDGPPEKIRRREAFPIGLVLEPTRELAVQTQREALKFAYKTGIRCVVVHGGKDFYNQENEINRGIDILIATPGRLIDFLERGMIDLAIVRYLILDEGDRMLDMGFEPQIRRILRAMHGNDHETIMCSATFPEEMKAIAATFMKDFVFLAIGRVGSTSENITQTLYHVEDHLKLEFLIRVLQNFQGITLIFLEKKRSVDWLFYELSKRGFICASIHGDKSQGQREKALDDFKRKRVKILVATDVASRGLDIPDIDNVINFDTPNYIDHYVHRIGRTGRIGKSGKAFSFINSRNQSIFRDLMSLLRESNQEIPEWFEDLAAGRMTQDYSEMLPFIEGGTNFYSQGLNPSSYDMPRESRRGRGRGYRGGYDRYYQGERRKYGSPQRTYNRGFYDQYNEEPKNYYENEYSPQRNYDRYERNDEISRGRGRERGRGRGYNRQYQEERRSSPNRNYNTGYYDRPEEERNFYENDYSSQRDYGRYDNTRSDEMWQGRGRGTYRGSYDRQFMDERRNYESSRRNYNREYQDEIPEEPRRYYGSPHQRNYERYESPRRQAPAQRNYQERRYEGSKYENQKPYTLKQPAGDTADYKETSGQGFECEERTKNVQKAEETALPGDGPDPWSSYR
ncbi:unnamed protein product [Blepharisma stoltei]|uniref:RNA helicase n=1 Tax=Blepharisma stoltei TaxID=1481888 RepID=A0AAU9IMR1_9CILI|nr:unnamed protein product [Blepharisma stoltei]